MQSTVAGSVAAKSKFRTTTVIILYAASGNPLS